MTLLDHIRTLVEAEQGLTEALEKTLPLLSHDQASSVLSSSQQNAPPLLPTPRHAREVPTVLAVARAYALRTSAPPMWNPNLPVVGFATPNPLPHQLRGGALGAMQLQRAREERSRRGRELTDRRERRRRSEEEAARRGREDAREGDATMREADGDAGPATAEKRQRTGGESAEAGASAGRKQQEMLERQRHLAKAAASNDSGKSRRQTTEEYQKKKAAANMNLSDSSSSSGEEDDDSD